MKILIDIGHPAQVHLFRPFAQIMQKKGHRIVFTCRRKEFEIELLAKTGFEFICLGKHYKKRIWKIWGLIEFTFKLLIISLRLWPDIFLSAGSLYAAPIAWLLGKPHISMEDTGNMEQVRWYLPFTDVVLSPEALPVDLGNKQLRYSGYHELAYLHPKYFKADKQVHKLLLIEKDTKYFLLRFIAWNATHDKGQRGLSDKEKAEIVALLAKHGEVFISAEAELPDHFEKYRINISPEKLHDVLKSAKIVISEGATIASEAGILGTPSIYVNSMEACNNYDQEKYGTVSNFKNGIGLLDKIKEVLERNENGEIRQNKIIEEKIDVTAFLVWFVEAYPQSEHTLKNNPKYQLKFQ